jgi:hypothetical protein
MYVHTKCHSNQSSFTQLSLHSLTLILIFNFFTIHCGNKAVECQNILKATVQHTVVKPMHYFVSVVKELPQATAQHKD